MDDLDLEIAAAAAKAARARQGAQGQPQATEGGPSNTDFFFRGAYDALLSPADLVTYPVRALSEALGLEMPAPSTTVSNAMRGLGAAIAPEDAVAETRGQRVSELAGGGLGIIAPGFGITSAMAARGGPVMQGIGQSLSQTMAARPGATAAAEVAAGAGAGLLGYEAEQAAEGTMIPPELARGVGELAGGLAGAGLPAVSGAAARGVGSLMDMVPGVSAARQITTQLVRPDQAAFEKASTAVRGRLEGSPEDAIAALYDETLLDLTPAQRIGQDRFLKLEQDILKQNPILDKQYQDHRAAVLTGAREDIAGIGEGGSIRDTVTAMEDWVQTSRTALETSAEDAISRANEAIRRAGPQNMRSQSETSEVFREALDQSYRAVRQEESALWSEVPDNVTAPTTLAQDAYARSVADAGITRLDRVPQAARRFLDPESPDFLGPEASARDYQGLMSALREDARVARANNQAFTAKIADDLAEAISRDFDAVPGMSGPLAAARAFSRNFNEVYRRGPIGQVLGTNRMGGDQVAPEETLNRLLNTTGERLTARTGAVEAAVGRGAPTGGFNPEAANAASDYLRRQFSDTAMNEAGDLRPSAAERFVASRRDTLDRYPALAQMFDDAVVATRAAADTQKTVESELAALAASPAQRLSSAKMHQEFDTILSGAQNPAFEFSELRAIAEESGPAAVDGLKSAAASYLLRKGTKVADGSSVISGNRILSALNDPRTMDAMTSVLDPAELQRVQQLGQELSVIEASDAARRGGVDNLVDEGLADTALQLVARVLGAAGGRMATPPGGATIQNPQIGSQIMRTLARRLTSEGAEQLVIDSISDPQLMEALLLGRRAAPESISRQADTVLQRWMTNNMSRVAIDADDALQGFIDGFGLPPEQEQQPLRLTIP